MVRRMNVLSKARPSAGVKDLSTVQKSLASFDWTHILAVLFVQPVVGHLRSMWRMTFFSSFVSTLFIGRNLVVDAVNIIPGKTMRTQIRALIAAILEPRNEGSGRHKQAKENSTFHLDRTFAGLF